MQIMEDNDGITIKMDQSKNKNNLFYAMGVSRVIQGAIADGCRSVFVNTKPDGDGGDRILLSFRKTQDRQQEPAPN